MPSISGVVYDSSGNPAIRTVRAYLRSSGAFVNRTLSAGDGSYSITVPTTAEHIVVAHDATLANATKLLVPMNGTNGSTAFTDSAGHTVTVVGSAAISTAQGKFNGSSAYFNGSTGNWLKVPYNDFVVTSAQPYCFEAWVYPTTMSGQHGIFGYDTEATGRRFFGLNGANLYIEQWGTGVVLSVAHNMTANNWYHVAFVRDTTTQYAYVNGVLKGSVGNTSPFGTSSGSFAIGSSMQGGEHPFQGYIDCARAIIGEPVYITAFTPSNYELQYLANTEFGGNAIVYDRVIPI
ncbi:MAG: LamG domain-containing protein [Desulfurellales bacterium]|nr:MAG: LamG domain-containing protein [Desulfurellales bacterium]